MSDFAKVIDEVPEANDKVVGWITTHLKDHKFLLAFADDGVIWGQMDDKKLVTSHDIDGKVSPELRGKTLQQAFIFDDKEEVRLFRDEANKWQARCVVDGNEVIEESQILSGDRVLSSQRKFTHVLNARQQGLSHIVPLEIENSQLDPDEGGTQCLCLDVHHTIDFNANGEAYVAVSRLAGLRIGNKNEEV